MDFKKGTKQDQATLKSTLDFSPSSAGTKTSFTEMNLQEIKLMKPPDSNTTEKNNITTIS